MIDCRDQTINNVIYLATRALNQESVSRDELESMDLPSVFNYAHKSSISAIVFSAINNALSEEELNDENSPYFQYKILRLNAYRRNTLFDQETVKLIDFFEKEKIWYLPLKGSVIKNMYPSPDLREMNDVDILIDPNGREKTREFMLAEGYTIKPPEEGQTEEDGNSDEYIKDPFLFFEIHKFLIEDYRSPKQAEYFNNIKNRLVRDGDGYSYHFTDEDFYLYMISHAYKHFIGNGIGLRFLMDVYVYLNKKDSLDFEYIENKCSEFDIQGFESDIRKLSSMIFDLDQSFSLDDLAPSQRKMLEGCLVSETFGTLEGRWKSETYKMTENANNDLTKRDYIKKRIFPDERWYRIHHPFVARHKILKGPFVIYRLVVLGFRGRNRIKREMDYFDEGE